MSDRGVVLLLKSCQRPLSFEEAREGGEGGKGGLWRGGQKKESRFRRKVERVGWRVRYKVFAVSRVPLRSYLYC